MPKLELVRTPANWLPKGGDQANMLPMRVTVKPTGTTANILFSLSYVSSWPGYCSNAGDAQTPEPDLKIVDPQPNLLVSTDGRFAVTVAEVSSCAILVKSFDYGAFGKLFAETFSIDGQSVVNCAAEIVEDDGDVVGYATIPRDEDADKMADSWEQANLPTWLTDITELKPSDDDDWAYTSVSGSPAGSNLHKTKGDGLLAFDEYRGFMWQIPTSGPQRRAGHQRFKPGMKAVFYDLEANVANHASVPGHVLEHKIKDLGYFPVLLASAQHRPDRYVDKNSYSGTPQQRCIRIFLRSDTIYRPLAQNVDDSGEGHYRNVPRVNGNVRYNDDAVSYYITTGPWSGLGSVDIVRQAICDNIVTHELGHSLFLDHGGSNGELGETPHAFSLQARPNPSPSDRCIMQYESERHYNAPGMPMDFCDTKCRNETKVK